MMLFIMRLGICKGVVNSKYTTGVQQCPIVLD
jgi:hypothetical protein